MVITPDGYVVTNSHVVENSREVTVMLAGGDEYSAEVVGCDAATELELVLLRRWKIRKALKVTPKEMPEAA